jgi:hypothetical protein
VPAANKKPRRAFQRCSLGEVVEEEGVLRSQSQHMVANHNQEVVIWPGLIIRA